MPKVTEGHNVHAVATGRRIAGEDTCGDFVKDAAAVTAGVGRFGWYKRNKKI